LATAWCADDQQTALTELKAGVELPVNQCEGNPIAAQYELGKEMGVSGTPAIVTSSGELIPGYRPAAALVALLGLD
jgi:thiol:disulfide interchange protein DsbC